MTKDDVLPLVACYDQDWEACKDWWRAMSEEDRADVEEQVLRWVGKNIGGKLGPMAKMLNLSLLRLWIECQPGTSTEG